MRSVHVVHAYLYCSSWFDALVQYFKYTFLCSLRCAHKFGGIFSIWRMNVGTVFFAGCFGHGRVRVFGVNA